MRKHMFQKFEKWLACVGLSLCTGGVALAAEPADPDAWQSSASLYLWLPSVGGDFFFEPDGGGSATVDASDILNALNMAFMGAFETRKDRWSLLADVIYLNLSQGKNSSVSLPFGTELRTKVDLKIKGWQVGVYGGYNLYTTEKARLDAIAGVRYLTLDSDAKFAVDLPPPIVEGTRRLSGSADVWDGVVGFRGQGQINEHWFVPYYADVGTGDSDITWQVMAGIGYRASWGDTTLVYRHLEWDMGDDKLLQDLNFSGPAVAFTFHF